MNAFELIDPTLCNSTPITRVGEGFHSLQLYANTFWLDHFLDYVTVDGHNSNSDHYLLTKQLMKLCRLYGEHCIEGEEPGPNPAESSALDKRIGMLASWGDAYTIVQRILWHRRMLRDRQDRFKGRFLIMMSTFLFAPKQVHLISTSGFITYS